MFADDRFTRPALPNFNLIRITVIPSGAVAPGAMQQLKLTRVNVKTPRSVFSWLANHVG
jgi:hypothetical protein